MPFLEKWLAARTMRRKALPQGGDRVRRRDRVHGRDGEVRRVPDDAVPGIDRTARPMWLVQGFRGFKDLSAERANMRSTTKRDAVRRGRGEQRPVRSVAGAVPPLFLGYGARGRTRRAGRSVARQDLRAERHAHQPDGNGPGGVAQTDGSRDQEHPGRRAVPLADVFSEICRNAVTLSRIQKLRPCVPTTRSSP